MQIGWEIFHIFAAFFAAIGIVDFFYEVFRLCYRLKNQRGKRFPQKRGNANVTMRFQIGPSVIRVDEVADIKSMPPLSIVFILSLFVVLCNLAIFLL